MKPTLRPIATALAAVCFALSASAQVEVVESSNRLLDTPPRATAAGPTLAATPAPAAGLDGKAELFYQVQMLQQEVLELRGQVEELSYELKRLKQQRLDDYVSLDRRLSALTEGGALDAAAVAGQGAGPGASGNAPAAAGSPPGSSAASSANPAQPPAVDEVQSYRTAIDLVLRQKDYEQAMVAFQQYLTDFPQGRYAPNSQYWLGEITLLQNDLEQAREWFTRLLNEYADHAKAPDATYKLGTVYDKLGDSDRARQLLEQVAQGDTNAARLAANYLAEMARR